MNKEENVAENGGLPESVPSGNSLETLLASAGMRAGALTVRDDLYDEAMLLDAVRMYRKGGGGRFRLVDSGNLDRFRLEWLLEAGADLYTSDEFRTDPEELEGLLQAAGKGRSILAYFVRGSFPEEGVDGLTVPNPLEQLGRAGAYLHVSNRDQDRSPDVLLALAAECEAGGSHMVIYHHGPFGPEMTELAGSNLWFHLDEHSLADPEARGFFLDVLKSRGRRARFVLYSEGKSEAPWLKEILTAGAYLRFQGKQFDYRSPYKSLESAASRKKLPHTAYYLHHTFLL